MHRKFLSGNTTQDILPKTCIGSYPWKIFHVQSKLPHHIRDELGNYTLSPNNRILQIFLRNPEMQAPVKHASHDERHEDGFARRRCRPWRSGGGEQRRQESADQEPEPRRGTLTITRMFRPTSKSLPRRSALDRIEPRPRSTSTCHRSYSRHSTPRGSSTEKQQRSRSTQRH